MLPDRMNREDAFKVLSYLTDYIEKQCRVSATRSVGVLDEVLGLERLGFRKENINFSSNEEDIIDLFTVSGRLLLFKKSKEYDRYFEWYREDVDFDEVKEIYKKCGIEFYDLKIKDHVEKMPKMIK